MRFRSSEDLTKLKGACEVEAQAWWHILTVVEAAKWSCAQAGVGLVRKGAVQEDGWTDKADSVDIILRIAWLGWEQGWAVTKWFSGQSLTTEQEYRSLRLLPWPGLQYPGALARATACKPSSPFGLTGKSGPSLSRKTLKAKKDKCALSSCLPACTSHCS